MDASTSPMMAFSIYLAFPVLSGKQVLTAFSLNALLWTFLIFTGISLVVKEPHRPCEDVALAKDSTLSKWLEYSFSTNTHERMQLTEKNSKEFHLTVVAHSEACEIPTANVTLHGEDRICIHAKNVCQFFNRICFGAFSICSGGWHAKHVSITFAEIVLRTEDTLEIKEQLNLICTMAEYLHLDPSSLTLIPVEDSLNKYFQNLTVLAEDIRYINSTKGHRVGLCWPVGFGVFAMLPELIQVLSHNVESDNLSQLLGYEIVGWRVLKQGYEKRNPNKWQKRKMATPKPTWRPTQTQNFTVLVAAVPETHSVVKSEMSSSLVKKATFSVIHPYMDLSTRPGMVHMNLETPRVSKSTMFHYLSSEISPSLMLSSTEFEEKGAFQTPPISEHLLYEALLDTSVQEDFPTTQKSEPKDSSTLYYLNLFMPFTKNHFSNSVHHLRDILPEEMPSTSSSSPKLFSGELRNLNDHSPFLHRTASGFKSGEIISIIELSLPSMVTLAYLRTSLSSSELSFSSVAISLLFLHDSYQNPELFNVDSSASDTFMTLAPMKEIDVSKWIKSSILINILSIFDAIVTNGDFEPKPGSPSNACPPTRLYYCGNGPTSSKHSTDTLDNSTSFSSISLLTFSFLSKTISNPVIFPSFSSVPVELTLFGSSNIFPMEKLPDRRQVSSDGMNACESFTTIPLTYRFVMTGSSVLVFMKTEMDTSLWIKGTTLFSSTTSSAVILSSGFLNQGERSHRKTQEMDLLPCGSSWIIPCLELIHTSSFHFSTYQCDSIHNLVRTPVLNHDTLQLETNSLSLESSFGTKMNVQITRNIVSTLKEPDIVFSRKGQVNSGLLERHKLTQETFHDQEDGNSTQLTLGMNPIDGSPTDLESWLQFNAKDKRMYGYPLDADFQYSPQEFLLFAIDSGGLKTEDKFVVEIFKATIIPCHVYMVITRDSYHSFLKNRKRIYFFLKKLSDYLLVESPGDVVLLHLKTGSAVFTWYNKSFCPKAEKCARDDIQDVLTKLGRPREDVHPGFAEAMLPEFKIEQIGEVGYSGMCLSTTKPTKDSVVFNRTATGFEGSNCWITNALTALLVAVCCTILVFLIIVHCQKYRKKTFQPECSPSCGHINFKMGMLTSRKSPLLEQDVPPSTRLPIPMPMVCQQRSFRPHRGLVISRLPSPPKYRLPP
ncbi:Dystroglycan, partial [Ophiophagus hannah]